MSKKQQSEEIVERFLFHEICKRYVLYNMKIFTPKYMYTCTMRIKNVTLFHDAKLKTAVARMRDRGKFAA